MKDRIQRFVEITGIHFSEEKIEVMIEAGNYLMLPESPLDLTELEKRHAMLMSIENGLRVLQGLFYDVQQLIGGQGEVVDRIENIVLMSEMYVNDGMTSTKQAHISLYEYRLRRRRCVLSCCYFLMAAISFLIVIYFISVVLL